MNKAHHSTGLVVWLSVAGLAVTACACDSRAVEFCDAKCECTLCNDREYDECVIDKEHDIDVAAAYECDQEYDELLTCVLDKADCDDYAWVVDADDCDNETEDYADCVDDASDLGGGGGNPTCACTCNGVSFAVCQGNGCCNNACAAQCDADGFGGVQAVDEQCG